jgi:hypothetical protein
VFGVLLAGTPTEAELAACEKAMSGWRALYTKMPPPEATRRVRSHLVQALLNHNDFVTIR